MSQPFFSICIPNYNYEGYVGITLESVLAQTFTDFEVLVADNASTDKSMEVIESYAAKDSRIKAFRNNYNVGFAPNLQKATERATGRFLILLSSDDLIWPTALEEYHKVLTTQAKDPDNTVLHSGFDQIDSQGELIRICVRKEGKFDGAFVEKDDTENPLLAPYVDHWNPLEAMKYGFLTQQGIGAFLTICYPKALYDKVEGYDPTYHIFPDKAFLFKLLIQEPDYIYVNQRLFGYRIHQSNQNSKSAAQGALKHQVDGYMRAVNTPQGHLDKLGITREQVQQAYIKNHIIQHAYIALNQGYRTKARKIMRFGYGTFPQHMKGNKVMALRLFLAFGPIGQAMFKALYKARQ